MAARSVFVFCNNLNRFSVISSEAETGTGSVVFCVRALYGCIESYSVV